VIRAKSQDNSNSQTKQTKTMTCAYEL